MNELIMITSIVLVKDHKNTIIRNPEICSQYIDPVMQKLVIGFEGRNHTIGVCGISSRKTK